MHKLGVAILSLALAFATSALAQQPFRTIQSSQDPTGPLGLLTNLGGGQEIDLINAPSTASDSFRFYQTITNNARTLLFDLSPTAATFYVPVTLNTVLSVASGGTGQSSLNANAFLTGNGISPINQVAITGLVLGNGASPPAAYAGAACTNQFLSALSAAGAGTCTSPTLTSAQFANQGTATTVLHGNAAGNPTFGPVVLATDVSGTLPVASGGTGDTGTAWTTYAPAPACGTATFTVNSARFKQQGKNVWYGLDITVTAVGTCTATISFTLPVAAQNSGSGAGREMVNTGKSWACGFNSAGATTSNCSRADVSQIAVNDRYVLSGTYEAQ